MLSEKLLNFNCRTESKVRYCSAYIEIQLYLAYTVPLLIIEAYKTIFYEGYEIKYRVWNCGTLSLFYVHFFMIASRMGFQFVYLNLFINVKQRYYLTSMKPSLKFNNYCYFKGLLKQCLVHIEEINAYNTFYSKYITALTFCYGSAGCALLISAQYAKNVLPILLVPGYAFGIIYLFCIFMFTAVGSKTMFLNKKLFQNLISFQISLCTHRWTHFRCNLIHLDLVNEYKPLLLRTSSRLTTSSVLNNKFFFFRVLALLSAVYVKIVARL